MAELMALLGLSVGGGSYPAIRAHLSRLGLETSLDRSVHGWNRISDEAWCEENLRRDNPVPGERLKRRMLGAGLLVDKCYACELTQWRGQRPPTQIEHINGDHADNRRENVTLLCANCHCQTPTWGRKKR